MEGRSVAAHLRRITTAGLLAVAALAAVGAGTASATQAEYDHGLALGTEAYKYGLPLITIDKTYRNQTSIDVPNGKGFGPANRFNPVRELIRPEDKSVVAPNYDTLYSIAWLNLRRQPQIIHVPRVRHRYFVIPLMDPYTKDFKNLGSVKKTKPGDYAVVGPNDAHVKLPKGVRRIRSDYNRVFIIERTYVDEGDRSDVKKVHKIQNKLSVTPLSKYGRQGWRPRKPRHPDTTVNDPGLPGGLAYFDKLGKLLKRYPPPTADRAELKKLAAIGVGPGMTPSTDASLSPDTVRGMVDAVAKGPDSVLADVKAAYLKGFATHNGYLTLATGRYGTDYTRRALVTQVGLGALTPEQSIYPLAQVDKNLQPLNGSEKYVLHIPAGQLPPVKGFWSVTMYDTDGFLVPNPIGRYLINDRSHLSKNADGSIDIYIQSHKPAGRAKARNWLPSPPGAGFRLIWRLYQPKPHQIDSILDGSGWTPPTITPVP